MPLNKCKRLTVHAMGVDKDDNVEHARNGNRTKCKGIPGKCGCIHAEINLLKKMPNPTMVVVSHSPCLECAKALVSAKVALVRYLTEYRIRDGIDYLKENGVDVRGFIL